MPIQKSFIKTLETKTNNSVSFSQNKNSKILLKIFKDILNNQNIRPDDNFFEHGGDSISMMQCIARANQAGLDIFHEIFMINPTVSYLASQFSPKTKKNNETFRKKNIPLLPLQTRFFIKPRHWSKVKLMPSIVNLNRNIDLRIFNESCKRLFLYHDALNLRFAQQGKEWRQFVADDEKFFFEFMDFSYGFDEKIYNAYIEDRISKFNLENGYLIKFLVVDFGIKKPYHFILATHHLCIDGVSLKILLQDILYIYSNLFKKNNSFKINQTSSFKEWAYFLSDYANSKDVKNDLVYWQSMKNEYFNLIPIDFKYRGQENNALDIEEHDCLINVEISRKTCKVIPKNIKNISVLDILLTTFIYVMNKFTKSNTQLIDIRRHGRDIYVDNIDLTKTVGWLTVVHPVFLKIDNGLDLTESIYSVHEQLSGVPKNGLSYGLLRYLVLDESIKLEMENLPRSQIAFNYHGIMDAEFTGNDLFSFFKKTTGNNSGVNVTRSHLLNIDIMVRDEQINIIWTYSKKFHKKKTIALLQKQYESMLKKVVSSVLSNVVNA